METCKNCGKPLILKEGKCLYCGADPNRKSGGIQKMTGKLLFKKTIDIVFCVDCSWPMAPVLDSVKDNIVRLLKDINSYNENISSEYQNLADWRARVIGYRNFEEDNECLLNDNPFVSDIEDVKEQLSGLVCKGYSENNPLSSSLDALWYAVQTSDWRDWDSIHYGEDWVGGKGRHVFVVLFTSMPPLPIHDKTLDEVMGADRDINRLSETMYEKHITLTFFGPNDSVYKALRAAHRSEINLFEDPIEFYYHKQLDFSSILNSFNETLS